MERPRLAYVGTALIVGLISLLGMLACSGSAAPPASTGQSDDVAGLKQEVTTQAQRISALETRVALPQPTASPSQQGAAAPGAPTRPPAPTPTVIPAVVGLATDGAAKGVASAKVTLTEYIDYL